jgi:hypothetical protein
LPVKPILFGRIFQARAKAGKDSEFFKKARKASKNIGVSLFGSLGLKRKSFSFGRKKSKRDYKIRKILKE